jgi:hypothetical protein
MHSLDIWYLNENDSQEAGVVSTLSLTKQFQLFSVVQLQNSQSRKFF